MPNSEAKKAANRAFARRKYARLHGRETTETTEAENYRGRDRESTEKASENHRETAEPAEKGGGLIRARGERVGATVHPRAGLTFERSGVLWRVNEDGVPIARGPVTKQVVVHTPVHEPPSKRPPEKSESEAETATPPSQRSSILMIPASE